MYPPDLRPPDFIGVAHNINDIESNKLHLRLALHTISVAIYNAAIFLVFIAAVRNIQRSVDENLPAPTTVQ